MSSAPHLHDASTRADLVDWGAPGEAEEAVSCAFRRALEPGDMNFPTYRQAGLLIAGGYPMVTMMNQNFSNEADPLKGRQLPVLYASKEHGFFSVSGNLGGVAATSSMRPHCVHTRWWWGSATLGS